MQTIQQIFETKYAEENEISPEELAKSRWLSGDGFNLPRVNRAYRYFRDGYLSGQQTCVAPAPCTANQSHGFKCSLGFGHDGTCLMNSDIGGAK